MAIFFPPPPPFMGAAQPHAPRKLPPAITAVEVDNPPFTTPSNTPAQQTIAAINATAFLSDPYAFVALGADDGPYMPRQNVAGVPGQSVDSPQGPLHPGHSAVTASITIRWQPDPWVYDYAGPQPYSPKVLSPGIPGQSINNPPFEDQPAQPPELEIAAWNAARYLADRFAYVYAGAQPYGPKQNAPGIPGQSINNPPFGHRARTAAALAIAGTNATLFQSNPWSYAFAGDSQPYGPLRMSVGIPGQSIDKPPFIEKRALDQLANIIVTWQRPPNAPTDPNAGYMPKYTITYSQVLILG